VIIKKIKINDIEYVKIDNLLLLISNNTDEKESISIINIKTVYISKSELIIILL